MPTAIEPGAIIDGKYRVVRRIGEGGMGTVYEGENVRIERRVAIKVLHEHVASSPEFAQRFEREARASARIGSPHVCDVLDLGDLPNGERFIVMEFLDGESLEDRLEKGMLTAAQLAPIAFEILEGLGTMHQAGVVHRDLKPANVFLARGPRGKAEVVKILDFGVAKILPRADEPSDMTSTGMMMGTPLYMSPEQARGARDVDGRTDLYAASVIFYRALTGELPHSGANLHELLFKIVLEEPRPIRELAPDVDETFAAIVTRGLARDANERYASAREYQEEIAAWGASQGRASLQFAVTLPSDPPPLRQSSGGFPVELIKPQTPITGPQLRPEKVGPPTPAVAKTQTETPSAKQSGGTPIVWSEDAPEIAKRALAELEAKKKEKEAAAAASAGKTQVLDTRPSAPPNESVSSAAPAPHRPTVERSQARSRVAMAAGAAAVLAIAAIGLRYGAPSSSASTSGSPSSSSTLAPVAAPEPPPTVPSSETTTASSTAPAPPEEPAPSAEPAPAVTTASTAVKAPARVAAPATAATSPKGAPPVASASGAKAAPAASSATPSTAPTTKTRKFRTNLD